MEVYYTQEVMHSILIKALKSKKKNYVKTTTNLQITT